MAAVTMLWACGTGTNLVSAPCDAGQQTQQPGSDEVDPATFARLVDAGLTHPDSPAQAALDQQAADEAAASDRSTVDAYLSANAADPAVGDWGKMVNEAVDPSLKRDAEGHLLEVGTAAAPLTVHTLAVRSKLSGAADTVRGLGSRANQLGVYRSVVDALPPEVRARYQLLTPAQLETSSDADLKLAVSDLGKRAPQLLAAIAVQVPSIPELRKCEADFGRGRLLDRYGFGSHATVDACATPRSSGIVASFDWPLKSALSCVKNQASRGTCWAFAATSMMETAEAVKHDAWVNYSEQDLVNRVKLIWYPTAASYGDNAGLVLPRMIAEHYTPVFENAWSYNPSSYRTANDVEAHYAHSCDSYVEDCSDTNHQGRRVCYHPGSSTCVFAGHDNPGDTHAPTARASIFYPSNMDLTVAVTRLALALRKGVGLGFDVHPAFDAAGRDGWVHYDAANPGVSRGGHFVHVVGFIDNEQLAATLPNAPAGLGGGYFVVKNSWGTCAGDAGYYYLPVMYVMRFGWSLEVLSGIE